ncbi:MAG: helix-turn-helix domain-containing protein [Solirubrobacterales bacterium]
MSDLPRISSDQAAVIAGHALIPGPAAARLLTLLPGNYRREILRRGVGGEDLAQVEEAVAALGAAATASVRGNAEGQRKPAPADSGSMTSDEAASILGVTESRVRQMARAGEIEAYQAGGRWWLPRHVVDQKASDRNART